MKYRTWVILLSVLFLSSGLFVLYRSVREHDPAKYEEEKGDGSGDREQTSSTDKEQPEHEEGLRGKAQISRKSYWHIYSNQVPLYVNEFRPESSCSRGRGKHFAYSFVDFLFVEKTETNRLSPYEVDRFSYRKMGKKFGSGVAVAGNPPSARVRMPVVRDCQNETSHLTAGDMYLFSQFNFHDGREIINYEFEIPPKEELDFVPADGDKEPTPYPYPIRIEDMRASDDEDKVLVEERTFTVRNGISSRPEMENQLIKHETKLGYMSSIEISYKKNEEIFHKIKEISDNGVYKIKRKVQKDRDVLGGNLRIVGIYGWMKGIPDRINDELSTSAAFQLLRYKTNIRSTDIDLSESLAYEFKPEKTVKKEISIEPLLRKNDIEMSSVKLDDVQLLKKIKSENVSIFTTFPYKKHGEWHTMIDAEPGTYVLVLGRHLLDKHFEWPTDKQK